MFDGRVMTGVGIKDPHHSEEVEKRDVEHKAERFERNPLFLLRCCDGDTVGIVKCEKTLVGG